MATETNVKGTPGKKSKLLLLMILLAAALAAVAGCYYIFYGPYAAAKVDQEPPLKTVDIGNMTVNLADAGARYLRVQIMIELPEDSELEAEFAASEHRIRHDLLHTLRQKTAADVRDPDDLDDMCAELLGVVNRHLTAGQAQGLYLPEYLLQ